MTITEFLLARIEEDEQRATSGWSSLRETRWETDNYGRDHLTPAAVLAECKVKRDLLRAFAPHANDDLDPWVGRDVIAALATVYNDHEDYRQEWAL